MSLSFLMPTNAMRVAGISLHRRADIFGESFLTPGDAGRFIGWRVVETVEGAALAAIDAVERWTELDFGVRPDLVAGVAQSLEHLLAGSGVLPQCRSGRSCNPPAGRKLSFFSRDMVPSIQIEMASELSIFAPLRQALLCCFRFY